MSTLVTRSGKGSPLTHNEVDTNFTNLNTDKVEKTAADITGGTINNTTIGATTPSTGVFTTLTAQNETLVGTGQNLILFSENLTNANWSGSGTTASIISTAFASNTSQLVQTTSAFFKQDATSISGGISGKTYTVSAWLWSTTSTGQVGLRLAGTSGASGAVLTVNLTSTPTRYSITGTFSAVADTYPQIVFDNRSFAGGDGVAKTYLVWGAQLSQSSSVGTYIPTTTTAVYGTPTLSFSGVASIGLQSDGSLYETSAGTGNVRFYTNNIAQEQMRVSHTASAVNYHQLTGSATGSGPIHSVAGSDTNIDLNLTTKGTGGARFNVGNGSKYTYLSSDSANNFQLIGAANTANLGIYATGGGSLRFYTAAGLLEEQLRIPQTASAVNFVQIAGAATSGAPVISVQGSDTNITAFYQTKGVGSHVFGTRGTTQQFRISDTGSAVNYFQANGSITGFGPVLSAQGSDTNIPAVVQPKGTGALQAQQTDSTATGGNARGANAVDWQTTRASASQVASATASNISGGANNTNSGTYSFVGSGFQNRSLANGAGVVTGSSNTASQQYAFVGAGVSNTASGWFNFIGSGFTNSGTSASAVTTQSGTMNATTAVTLSGSNANIKVGQYITGTSIASDTYVAAISGTSLTLSQAASGSSTSTLSFFTPHGVVVGGGNNQATGSYSFIGGGGDAGTAANRNVASGDWSVVVGGRNNTASGPASFIGGGGTWPILSPATLPNVATAVAAFIGAGLSNTASNDGAAVVGGQGNTASGARSFVGGGLANTSNANNSAILGGSYGTTRLVIGNHVFPACDTPVATSVGVSQSGLLVLGTQTTDATATILRSTTSAAGTTNQVILPNNSAYAFKGTVIANVTGAANGASWSFEGAIMRGANAASTVLIDTPSVNRVAASSGASAWVVAVTADTTNGGLAVTVTGAASTTIRWVCKAETTEVTF